MDSRSEKANTKMANNPGVAAESAAPLTLTLPNQVTIRAVVMQAPQAGCVALCSTDIKGNPGELNRWVFRAASLDADTELPKDYRDTIQQVDHGDFPILVFPTVDHDHMGNTDMTRGLLVRGLNYALRVIGNEEDSRPIWLSPMGTGSGKLDRREAMAITVFALATWQTPRPQHVTFSLDKESDLPFLVDLCQGNIGDYTTIPLADTGEKHVIDALQLAQQQAGAGDIVDARELLLSILAIEQVMNSAAFSRFAQIVPLDTPVTTPEPTKADTSKISIEVDRVRLSPWLYLSYCLALIHVARIGGKFWGRDLVTLVLLSSDPSLDRVLSSISLTAATVRSRWHEFTRQMPKPYKEEDWEQWWQDAGYAGDNAAAVRTGYSAESTTAEDRLNVEGEAESFARLIADAATVPPLSIGLLGNWGSGKSFFINLINSHVRELQGKAGYCKDICQIEFNAWHMLDSNLWASLVGHIFEKLMPGEDEEGEKKDQALAEKIQEARGAVAEAERELAAAQDSVENAREELQQAEETLSLGSITDAAANVIGLRASEQLNKHIASIQEEAPLYGYDAPKNIVELEALTKHANEARGSWHNLMAVLPRTGWRLTAIITLACVVAVCALTFNYLLPWLHSDAAKELVGGITALGAVLASILIPLLHTLHKAAGITADFVTSLKLAQDQSQEVIAGKTSLKNAYDRHDLLRSRLENARHHLSELERRKKDISSGERLRSFIQERARSSDYTNHQGLISLVRRDFKQLEELMEQRDRLSAQDEAQEQLFGMDRIVLYIDDLDRCPPRRVVEVLEAIHLLLSFRLFIVVVAVDSRWLLRSLEVHYNDLLSIGQGSNTDYREATPQNYLEKIFQVTYALAPMQEDAFSGYMQSLAEQGNNVGDITGSQGSEGGQTLFAPASATTTGTGSTTDNQGASNTVTQPAGDTNTQPDPNAVPTTTIDYSQLRTEPEETNPLIITRSERELLPLLHRFLDTPRQAKRVLNVYRLLKAPLRGEQRTRLEDIRTGQYKLVLILLAVMYGRPTLAPTLLRTLYESEDLPAMTPEKPNNSLLLKAILANGTPVDGDTSMETSHNDSWTELHKDIQALGLDYYIWEESRSWIGSIARFSLNTGAEWHTWSAPNETAP